ncbi:hypothetical protein Tco_0172903 [Tanacetum coccineum]
MSNMSEDIQYAGSDTHPPMLTEQTLNLGNNAIRLYCSLEKIMEEHMKIDTEGPVQERAIVFTDLFAEERKGIKLNSCYGIFLLQGIPKDIYSLINHYTYAKDIWDNVED